MATPWRRRGHHFVSPYNFAPEVSRALRLGPGRRVEVFDSTIRKAHIVPGGKLAPADQVRIAEGLAEAGVAGTFFNYFFDRARLAAEPKAQEIHRGARAICRRLPGLKKIACLYAFPKGFEGKEACELAMEAGVDVLEPGIPASDLERAADIPGTSRERLLEGVERSIEYCRGLGVAVACNFTDVGRADPRHLLEGLRRAIAAGAGEVRLTDSYGALSPDGARYLARLVRRALPRSVPVTIHLHDDFGMASAATVAAALEGCHPDVTVNGFGDKGGFAALEEVVLALELLYGVRTGVRLEQLSALSNLVERLTGIRRAPIKAVVGSDIFHVEADAAVARCLRGEVSLDDPGARVVARTYDPAIVGRQRTIVWGRTTLGGQALREKTRRMGLRCSEAQIGRIAAVIRRRLDAKRRYPVWLTEREVEAICRRVAGS
jgi:isopropylmalate/homocitrate/citramalate synthase